MCQVNIHYNHPHCRICLTLICNLRLSVYLLEVSELGSTVVLIASIEDLSPVMYGGTHG